MKKKLTIIIPCYNEEKGIGKVIQAIPKKELAKKGYGVHILVVDNNSQDKTAEIAKKCGAECIFEERQGKGYAIRTAIKHVSQDTDLVVMLDGDNTYDPKEMLRLIEPLDAGFCDVVIGSRLAGKIAKGSMSKFNRMGNWIFTFMVRAYYHENVTDVCTGYFAWKKPVLKELSKHLEADGFALEMEMITKMARMRFNIYSVPISYKKRSGQTNLRHFVDVKKILHAWMRNLSWKPYAKSKGE